MKQKPDNVQSKHIFSINAVSLAQTLDSKLEISDPDFISILEDILKISNERARTLVNKSKRNK